MNKSNQMDIQDDLKDDLKDAMLSNGASPLPSDLSSYSFIDSKTNSPLFLEDSKKDIVEKTNENENEKEKSNINYLGRSKKYFIDNISKTLSENMLITICLGIDFYILKYFIKIYK